jgi:hypothetical protein
MPRPEVTGRKITTAPASHAFSVKEFCAAYGVGETLDGTPIFVVWDEPMPGVGRCWFECPVCKQRARHLYLRQLACRRCSRLDYSSRHLRRSVPGLNRLRYLRRKIGLELRPFSPIPPRPSSHVRYNHIVAEIHQLEAGLVGHLQTDINDVLARRIRKLEFGS